MLLNLSCGCKIDIPWHQHSSPNPKFGYTYCQLHQNAERLLAFVSRSKSKKAQKIVDDITDVEQWLVNDHKPNADENMVGLALAVLRGQYKDIEPLIDFLSEQGIVNVVSVAQSEKERLQALQYKKFFEKFSPMLTELYDESINYDRHNIDAETLINCVEELVTTYKEFTEEERLEL